MRHLNRPHFILDKIAAQPNCAYSLRRLRSGYLGPLVAIRRSSDSAQRSFYATPNGDLDTAAIMAFIGTNTGFVAEWFDQTINANHALQGVAGDQPSLVISGVLQTNGGKPAIRFSNTGSTTLGLNGFKFAAPSTNWSFNQIGSADSNTALDVFGTDTLNPSAASGVYKQLGSYSFNRSGTNTPVAAPVTPASGALFISTITYTSANTATPYVNGTVGTSVSSINYTNGSAAFWYIGIYGVTSSVSLAGYVTEHISFPSVITDSDRKSIEFSQANYYGITVSL